MANQAATTTTLRLVLSQQKQDIPCHTPNNRNTTMKAWPELRATVWNEFNLANLNESYGYVRKSGSQLSLLHFDFRDRAVCFPEYPQRTIMTDIVIQSTSLSWKRGFRAPRLITSSLASRSEKQTISSS